MYENRSFAIFSTTEIDQVDFSLVCETSADTLRKSVDESKTFVKWDGGVAPDFVSELTTLEGPYTYTEILDILSTPEWSAPMEGME
jgi:hypothetical protein